LLSVGLDDNHSVAVWNWRKGTKLASEKGSQEKIFNAQFNPYSTTGEFVTVGIKHIKFWKVAGNGFVSKQGIFGDKGAQQTLLSIAFDKEFTYTGTNTGEIYQWKENKLEAVHAAHKGPVFTLHTSSDGIASGGKDGKIILWTVPGLKQVKTVDVNKIQTEASIRSVCWASSKILLGTRDGDVMEANQNGEVKYVIGGHGMGELWGLATHPSKSVFVTVSDDKALYIWDIPSKKMLTVHPLKREARSVAYSPDGQHLAIGYINGQFAVLKSDNLAEVVTQTPFKEAIHEIKFSPNGKYLAVGSHDNFVDIYQVGDKWARLGRCSGSSSYITHLDWNAESDLIATNSGAYERLFYQIPSCKRITVNSAAEKNINWTSWTGVLGDQVAGIWPKFSDGTDVNAVDRSHSGDLLATADDFGLVKLFQFPASDGAKFKEYRGHSAHVTNIRFTFNDSHLISIGGGDTAVFVWSLGVVNERDDDTAPIEHHYDSDVEKETKLEYVSRAEKMDDFNNQSSYYCLS
jgi:WD40 repeat protein